MSLSAHGVHLGEKIGKGSFGYDKHYPDLRAVTDNRKLFYLLSLSSDDMPLENQ